MEARRRRRTSSLTRDTLARCRHSARVTGRSPDQAYRAGCGMIAFDGHVKRTAKRRGNGRRGARAVCVAGLLIAEYDDYSVVAALALAWYTRL